MDTPKGGGREVLCTMPQIMIVRGGGERLLWCLWWQNSPAPSSGTTNISVDPKSSPGPPSPQSCLTNNGAVVPTSKPSPCSRSPFSEYRLLSPSLSRLAWGLLKHQVSVWPPLFTCTPCSSSVAPHSTLGFRQPISHQRPPLQTPSALLTLHCLLALWEGSLSHLIGINHSGITISSLFFSIDQITSPCSSTALFPLPTSLLTISFVQQAAWNPIFTPWQTRQHALKSFLSPCLIQIF